MTMLKAALTLTTLLLTLPILQPTSEGYVRSRWGEPDNPVRVKVAVVQNTYRVGEPVLGKVTLENKYPVSLPAVFRVQLFHHEKLVLEKTTAVRRVPMGKTSFGFDKFGIPFFNRYTGSEGVWRIKVSPQDTSSMSFGEAAVRIISSPDQ